MKDIETVRTNKNINAMHQLPKGSNVICIAEMAVVKTQKIKVTLSKPA